MPLQPKLNRFTTQAPIAAVIDFKDIESGLNLFSFYAASSDPSTGAEFLLSDNIVYSSVIEIIRTGAGTTTTTWDSSLFNIPKTVKGTAIFSCSIATNNVDGGASVAAQLQKWDGSTATDITSEITSVEYVINAGTDRMILLELPCTETHIAEGEQLRLITKFKGGGGGGTAMGTDPKGRAGSIVNGTNVTTTMEVQVPFKFE